MAEKKTEVEVYYYRRDGRPGWRRDKPYVEEELGEIKDQESPKSSPEKP